MERRSCAAVMQQDKQPVRQERQVGVRQGLQICMFDSGSRALVHVWTESNHSCRAQPRAESRIVERPQHKQGKHTQCSCLPHKLTSTKDSAPPETAITSVHPPAFFPTNPRVSRTLIACAPGDPDMVPEQQQQHQSLCPHYRHPRHDSSLAPGLSPEQKQQALSLCPHTTTFTKLPFLPSPPTPATARTCAGGQKRKAFA